MKKSISAQDQIKDLTVAICITMADNATGYGDIADHFRNIGVIAATHAFSLEQLQTVVSDLQATVTLAMQQDIERRVADNQCPNESKAICKSAYQGRLSDQIKKFTVPAYNETNIDNLGESVALAHFYRSDAGAAKIHSTPPKAKADKRISATGKTKPVANTSSLLPSVDALTHTATALLDQVGTGCIQIPEALLLSILAAGLADGSYSLSAVTHTVNAHVDVLALADSEKLAKEVALLELRVAEDRKTAAIHNIRKAG